MLKTLLPFLFLLALFLISNLLTFIFASHYIMCLLTYVKILFLSVVLKNLTISLQYNFLPLSLFLHFLHLLLLLVPKNHFTAWLKDFLIFTQMRETFSCYFSSYYSPLSLGYASYFSSHLMKFFHLHWFSTFYFYLCLVIWAPAVTSSLSSSAMLNMPLILSSLFFIPNIEILISRSLIQVYL